MCMYALYPTESKFLAWRVLGIQLPHPDSSSNSLMMDSSISSSAATSNVNLVSSTQANGARYCSGWLPSRQLVLLLDLQRMRQYIQSSVLKKKIIATICISAQEPSARALSLLSSCGKRICSLYAEYRYIWHRYIQKINAELNTNLTYWMDHR